MNKEDIAPIEFLKGKVYLVVSDVKPEDTDDFVYFTIEDSLPYNNFNLDFGPLHVGHLYRFAVALHKILNDSKNKNKSVGFYSSSSPKERTNAACILCCYMVLVQNWAPHQVLLPISQFEPPFMGFRDAGYSHPDFEITIQDIVYGVWRAKERNLLDMRSFNLEEYEQYERVDQGDLNILANDFIPFASPKQSRPGATLNQPFKQVLEFFTKNNVKLVVRLNSHLYDKREFTKRNMQHIDMIFEDGSCPTIDFVQKFIGAAESIISKGGKVAVHCKAGLGRTGCLIGAYLIYTHGFTANECIAYMRMIRPGMVVGPQQHWLYLHQNEFRDWRHTMVLDTIPDDFIGGLYPLISYEEYKKREQQENEEEDGINITDDSSDDQMNFKNDQLIRTPVRRRKISTGLKNMNSKAVPETSPGQPRKYRSLDNPVQGYVNSDEEDAYTSTINHTHNQSVIDDREIRNDRPTSSSMVNTSNIILNDGTSSSTSSPYYKKTTTTTTTTTISSNNSPNSSLNGKVREDPNFLKIGKQRKTITHVSKPKSRVSSSEKIIGGSGVRKTSSNKKSFIQM
ncbi:phosphoprotein phosphatase [Pichia kluyveri]|uniref:Tyrosine-protein phosphatase CDC14 n=1 Tax=Pichia kluyveri TaxID=36015 RepID=A0AAV5R3Y9_PICKL|nr:phosphoprotein phosphatase [Pichia kluyveri]